MIIIDIPDPGLFLSSRKTEQYSSECSLHKRFRVSSHYGYWKDAEDYVAHLAEMRLVSASARKDGVLRLRFDDGKRVRTPLRLEAVEDIYDQYAEGQRHLEFHNALVKVIGEIGESFGSLPGMGVSKI